jgi:hypothetical protein
MTKQEKSHAYYVANRTAILAKQRDYALRQKAAQVTTAANGNGAGHPKRKRKSSDWAIAWQRGYMRGRAFGKTNGHTNGHTNGASAQNDLPPEIIALTARIRAEVRTELLAALGS